MTFRFGPLINDVHEQSPAQAKLVCFALLGSFYFLATQPMWISSVATATYMKKDLQADTAAMRGAKQVAEGTSFLACKQNMYMAITPQDPTLTQ